MTIDEKREGAEAINWWHRMDLGDGVITSGPDPAEEKGNAWELTEELFRDKTVLDVGAWDGYFSFLAERLGAKEVTALDIGKKDGFEFAHKVYDSKVKYIIQNIMESTPEELGTFDVVLFPGVLYHMKFPYLSLFKAADLVKEGGTLFVETHTCNIPDVDQRNRPLPVMLFYPNRELANDPTNWWGPNNTCVIQMMQSLDFRIDMARRVGGDRCAYRGVKVTNEDKRRCPANPDGFHRRL